MKLSSLLYKVSENIEKDVNQIKLIDNTPFSAIYHRVLKSGQDISNNRSDITSSYAVDVDVENHFAEIKSELQAHFSIQNNMREKVSFDSFIPTFSLLEKEIGLKLNNSEAFDNFMKESNFTTISDALIGLKGIEIYSLSEDQNINENLLNKLNKLLNAELSSYKIPEEVTVETIFQSINQLNDSDQAVVSLPFLLTNWSTRNGSKLVENADKLITTNDILTDYQKRQGLHEVTREKVNKVLLDESVPPDIAEPLSKLVAETDLSTLQKIVKKLVDNVYGIDLNSHSDGSTKLFENNFVERKKEEHNNANKLLISGLNLLKANKNIDFHEIEGDITMLLNKVVQSKLNGLVSNQKKSMTDRLQNNSFSTFNLLQNTNAKPINKNGVDNSGDKINLEKYPLLNEIVNSLKETEGTNRDDDKLNGLPFHFGGLQPNPTIYPGVLNGSTNNPNDIDSINSNSAVIKGIVETVEGALLLPKEYSKDVDNLLIGLENFFRNMNQSLFNGIITGEANSSAFTKDQESTAIATSKNTSILNDISTQVEFTNQVVDAIKRLTLSQEPTLTKEVFLQLEPKTLGQLTIKQMQMNGRSLVKLEGSSNEAKLLLNQTINHVKEAFPYLKLEMTNDKVQAEVNSSNLVQNKMSDNTESLELDLGKYMNTVVSGTDNQKIDASTKQEFTNQLLNTLKSKALFQAGSQSKRLVLKLNPEHLGQLTVKLVQTKGEMVAKIIASTESAKELLEHSIQHLKQALPSVKIEIERFEVYNEQFSKPLKDSSEQQQKEERNHKDTNGNDQKENEQNFGDTLNDLLNQFV
ncbi:flagellar hook-length control protein FliK [Bacillus weihaiensis]|uniref:Flagellar hook-length control protein-like C-terminal domain-containing protein n=1 Tax=Bacillus weihaiensis TaxID=1547283 RepID=A0A1L3MSE2_9BACI|nr:flagellar hook-length control protein FliK [Bacillus weihaiensis]APH05255.1 hypothetical protein A9C19_11090 [Bacillus weihaiensis]